MPAQYKPALSPWVNIWYAITGQATDEGGAITPNRVNTLARAGIGRTLAAAAATARTPVLTTGTQAVSITAKGGDVRYVVSNSPTVVATNGAPSNFIAMGERLDLQVPTPCYIAAIADGAGTAATLEITELLG